MCVCQVVEDGYLTTKALSRWKRAAPSASASPSDAPRLASKRLRPVRGGWVGGWVGAYCSHVCMCVYDVLCCGVVWCE